MANKAVKTYQAFRSADEAIEEKLVLIEDHWRKIKLKLVVLDKISDQLGDDLLQSQFNLLHKPEGKPLKAKPPTETLQPNGRTSKKSAQEILRKFMYSVALKDSLDEPVTGLDEWQTRFDPTWYLAVLRGGIVIDPALLELKKEQEKSLSEEKNTLRSVIALRQAFNPQIKTVNSDAGTKASVNRDRSGLEGATENSIPFCAARTILRIGSTKLLILNADPEKFPRIRELYISIQRGRLWTQRGIWVLFESLVGALKSDPLYLIINGIHNCDSSRCNFLSCLLDLFNNEDLQTTLKVVLFGQECWDICEAVMKFGCFQMDALPLKKSPVQLANHLSSALVCRKPFMSEPNVEEALDRCEDAVQMNLNFNALMNRKSTDILSLESLKSEIKTLPLQVTTMVLQTFQALPRWARLALGWILHAQRPLKVQELSAAIALSDLYGSQSEELDSGNFLLDVEVQMESIFGPLVKIENNEIF